MSLTILSTAGQGESHIPVDLLNMDYWKATALISILSRNNTGPSSALGFSKDACQAPFMQLLVNW